MSAVNHSTKEAENESIGGLKRFTPLTCTGHSRPVPHVSFTPAKSLLGLQNKNSPQSQTQQFPVLMISSCKDGNPIIRDGITGDWLGTLIGHKGSVWCSKFSRMGDQEQEEEQGDNKIPPSGGSGRGGNARWAVSASGDFSARVWNVSNSNNNNNNNNNNHNNNNDDDANVVDKEEDGLGLGGVGSMVAELIHPHIVRSVDFAPHSDNWVVSGGQDGKVRLWQLNLSQSRDLPRDQRAQMSLEWDNIETVSNGDGDMAGMGNTKKLPMVRTVLWLTENLILSIGDDKVARLWQVSTLLSSSSPEVNLVDSVALSNDSDSAASCGLFEITHVRVNDQILPFIVGTVGKCIYALAVNIQRKENNTTVTKLQVVSKFTVDYKLSCASISPNGQLIMTGSSEDTWIRVYRVSEPFVAESSSSNITTNVKSVNYRDNTWLKQVDLWKGHHGPIHCIVFNPLWEYGPSDGTEEEAFGVGSVATSSEDGTVRLWKLGQGPYGLWQ